MNMFFPGFERKQIRVNGASIGLVRGAEGEGVLPLHGYPQTHCFSPREGLRSRLDSSTIGPRPVSVRL